jgi:hypothetical protein
MGHNGPGANDPETLEFESAAETGRASYSVSDDTRDDLPDKFSLSFSLFLLETGGFPRDVKRIKLEEESVVQYSDLVSSSQYDMLYCKSHTLTTDWVGNCLPPVACLCRAYTGEHSAACLVYSPSLV